jgi:hypothetical protein
MKMSNPILENKKGIAIGATLAIVGILVLTSLTAAYLPVSANNSGPATVTIASCPDYIAANPSTNAPVAGWFYFLQYNPTTGRQGGVAAWYACQAENALIEGGAMGSTNGTLIARALGLSEPVLVMNGNPWLNVFELGWGNAFYVNITTTQVMLIPGVSFTNNYAGELYNGQPTYNGQPIINATQFPTPAQ